MTEAATSGRVLIADDDAHTRNLLRELVESWGYQALVAEDGEQALALSAQAPDLALLDIMMPKLDGFEVLKKLREAPATRDIPVILLTAAGEVDAKIKGIELGADDYVTKPFRIVDLQQRLQAALAKRKQQSRGADETNTDPLTGVGTYPQLKEARATRLRAPVATRARSARRSWRWTTSRWRSTTSAARARATCSCSSPRRCAARSARRIASFASTSRRSWCCSRRR